MGNNQTLDVKSEGTADNFGIDVAHNEVAQMPTNKQTCKNILVIEDDGATRDALALFLGGEGHTVAVVKNG